MSTVTDRLRRVLVVLAVVVLLVLVPQVATARFSGGVAGSARVGTATMVAPTGLTGSYRCTLGLWVESIEVSLDGFTDAGPQGATYAYTLLRNGAVRASATSDSRAVQLSGTGVIDVAATRWELTVVARIGGWSSPVGRVTLRCPFGSTGSGTF